MIEFNEIEGDLIDLAWKGSFDVIIHDTNCYKVMGTQIPDLWQADQDDPRIPLSRLGDLTQVEIPIDEEINTFIGVNLYTQLAPGRNLDYSALALSLWKLNSLHPGKHVGLPLIGCGIGGGSWNKVLPIIKKELCDMKVTIVHFKPL